MYWPISHACCFASGKPTYARARQWRRSGERWRKGWWKKGSTKAAMPATSSTRLPAMRSRTGRWAATHKERRAASLRPALSEYWTGLTAPRGLVLRRHRDAHGLAAASREVGEQRLDQVGHEVL